MTETPNSPSASSTPCTLQLTRRVTMATWQS